MGRYIVKLEDYYLEWSTITDSPVTFGMSLDEFRDYYLEEYGKRGMEHLNERMERVKQKGVSAHDYDSVEALIAGNRAGPGESKLTLKEIYRAYCLMAPIRNGWKVPTVEQG